MYRFKRGIPVGYTRQGYIYFYSRNYHCLPAEEKAVVRNAARAAGGAYYRAVMDYVTTDTTHVAICSKYHLSRATLDRMVRKYYIQMDKELPKQKKTD